MEGGIGGLLPLAVASAGDGDEIKWMSGSSSVLEVLRW